MQTCIVASHGRCQHIQQGHLTYEQLLAPSKPHTASRHKHCLRPKTLPACIYTASRSNRPLMQNDIIFLRGYYFFAQGETNTALLGSPYNGTHHKRPQIGKIGCVGWNGNIGPGVTMNLAHKMAPTRPPRGSQDTMCVILLQVLQKSLPRQELETDSSSHVGQCLWMISSQKLAYSHNLCYSCTKAIWYRTEHNRRSLPNLTF